MKIAIHKQEPRNFSKHWIKYCEDHNIPFKIVNCWSTSIVQDLADCDALMWHWNQEDYHSVLFARQLTLSLEKAGKLVFPNVNTAWHFDDKVGQKYLLEAVNAPLIDAYVFYGKEDAEAWLDSTNFPVVFKLRGGAGSVNVKLAKSRLAAQLLVNKAFGRGFASISNWGIIKNKLWLFKRDKDKDSFIGIFKGIARIFLPTKVVRFSHRQKGYIYFQKFLAGNDFDTRLVVVGNRCFGVRRYNRKNDFRASGSGIEAYEKETFDMNMIKAAFDTVDKLGTQSLAFDFVYENNEPKIVEISYCFPEKVAENKYCGYWDRDLNFYEVKFNPFILMIEDFVAEINEKKAAAIATV
jgi:glutathione synthase/RimK-type ligase-like ATP-grasp enzyme